MIKSPEELAGWLEVLKEYGLINNFIERITEPEALEGIARGLAEGAKKRS